MTATGQASSGSQKTEKQEGEKNPWVARLGSVLIPGFGYIYTGKASEGVFWTFLTLLTYIFIVGALLHLFLIYNAGELVERYNQGEGDIIYSDIEDELET